MSIKRKTLHGLIWSFMDNFVVLGVSFFIGVILARVLSPREFGLIGMTSFFISLGQSIADSGFMDALIRKKNCTQIDYSTVFYFNIAVGLAWYIILVAISALVASFFNEPQLQILLPVIGLGVIFNALSLIQRTLLTKRLDFKLQTNISIASSMISGIVGLILAMKGFGVWSLVALTLTKNALNTLLLWVWNGWKPIFTINLDSLKELFGFGSKILLVGLINTTYKNIYLAVIGKYISSMELGYYTRADAFNQLPSQNITNVIQRVSYPVLSSIREDIPKLKDGYRKLIKSTMLISFVLMIGMAAISKSMVLTLIGDKWLVSAEYLELLCFVGMFYPLHALNLNMLNVRGRSDLFLRLEIIKKTLAIPTIVVAIYFGVKMMIAVMIINSVIGLFLNSYWSGLFIGYSVMEQINDIFPSFILAISMGILVFLFGLSINMSPIITLFAQIFIGGLFTIGIAELTKLDSYIYLKNILFDQIRKKV
ncbi:MAG: lipopolysaccharide biosynthesis protein [Bacteroidetes bacterium]|nr:lipopolysaccharide biosynthesis protein [Bacteroidota bacterium]